MVLMFNAKYFPPVFFKAFRYLYNTTTYTHSVIIHTCTWLYERDSKGGHCSAQCIERSII